MMSELQHSLLPQKASKAQVCTAKKATVVVRAFMRTVMEAARNATNHMSATTNFHKDLECSMRLTLGSCISSRSNCNNTVRSVGRVCRLFNARSREPWQARAA